jgi:vanillate O-demethylase monooxygenase subunit
VARGNHATPIHIRCNWQLDNDNLLDLTHLAYLHATSLGGAEFADYPLRMTRGDRVVSMIRWVPNVPPSPLIGKYRNFEGLCDRWQISEMTAPTHCMVYGGMAPTGQYKPTDNLAPATDFRIPITVTPDTEASCWMFYAHCRTFARDDKAMTEKMVTDFRKVFQEDVDAMEAQQRAMEARPNAPTIDVNFDAPTIAMRRLIDRLIAEEQGARAAAE